MLVSQPYNTAAGQDARSGNSQKPGQQGALNVTGRRSSATQRSASNASAAPDMSTMPDMTADPMAGTSPMSNMSMTGTSPMSKSGSLMPGMAGTSMTGMTPRSSSGMPPLAASPGTADTPTTVQSPYYTAGFLRNFLGKNMRVEFLIGTSGALVDRTGVLMEVGASYIVLRPYMTDDLLMCDLYSIKFVTIYG